MPLIALCSVKGRPGVTTTALGLAAVLPAVARPVVVECDPAGGDLAARHQLRATTGLMDLAAAARPPAGPPADPRTGDSQRGPIADAGDLLSRHAQILHLRDRVLDLVVAPPGGNRARAALTVLAEPANATLRPAARVVIADCGRLDTWSPSWPLIAKADVVLVLARGRGEDLAHLGEHLAGLSAAASARLHVLVTADRALYGPADIAALADADGEPVPVLAGLPADPHAVAVLAGDIAPGRRWRRLPLISALARLAAHPTLATVVAAPDPRCAEVTP